MHMNMQGPSKNWIDWNSRHGSSDIKRKTIIAHLGHSNIKSAEIMYEAAATNDYA